eukprot:6886828-Prymnesium_polylepis.1
MPLYAPLGPVELDGVPPLRLVHGKPVMPVSQLPSGNVPDSNSSVKSTLSSRACVARARPAYGALAPATSAANIMRAGQAI